MSLFDCPECGKNISTEATSCPHCGAPSAATKHAAQQATVRKQEKAQGCLMLIAGAVILLLIYWLAIP